MTDYYSRKDMSFSTWSQYMRCSECAYALETGDWKHLSKTLLNMAIGSLVHAHLLEPDKVKECELEHKDFFLKENTVVGITELLKAKSIEVPKKASKSAVLEMAKDNGVYTYVPNSNYELVNRLVDKGSNDENFMLFLTGEHEQEFFLKFEGVDCKLKIDSFNRDALMMADLKTTSSIWKEEYDKDEKKYKQFWEKWLYFVQAGWYRYALSTFYPEMRDAAYYLPTLGKPSSKDTPVDIAVLRFTNEKLREGFEMFKMYLPQIVHWRGGNDLVRCEKCDYCLATRKVNDFVYVG